ncbi:MAG: hypothetical protein LBI03_07685, partial [Clostridiales bacterium]|nr:hypothetical protein [Clostridiales bacterium]
MSHFTIFIPVPSDEYTDSYISDVMDPFWETTEDPDYLEFNDKTEELAEEYKNKKVNCIRLPHGRIVSVYNWEVKDFTIKDGKVYQEHAGPLKHEKRTKKAKKMLALPDYPLNKLYPTIEEYAEDFCGYTYDSKYDAYGYYHNPDAFWDWYQIGGRWPFEFLVKEDCDDII